MTAPPEGTLNLVMDGGTDIEDSLVVRYEVGGNDLIRIVPPASVNSNKSGEGHVELVDAAGNIIAQSGFGSFKRHEPAQFDSLRVVEKVRW